jgi:ABC-type nitrate/sulfonate/bicarbonate transport system substrate-binding protein
MTLSELQEKPMHKLTVTILAAAALAASKPVDAQDKVRVGYAVQVHQANMMILGEFARKHGFELELVPLRRYADLQLALSTNQIDAAAFGYINVGLMEEKSFRDYRVVAGVFTGGQNLTLHNDVKATTWKDLEGKKLGTAPNSYAELIFKASARLAGADLGKIATVSFAAGGPPLLSALKSKEIDGFVSWEPNNAEAVVGGFGYYSTLSIADNPTRGVNGVLAVNSAFIQSKRAAVLGLLRALVEATDALNADRERYVKVAVQGTGSAVDTVRAAIPRGALDYRLYSKEAVALLKLIHEAKLTQIDTSPAVAKQFDHSLLAEATGKPKSELGGGE